MIDGQSKFWFARFIQSEQHVEDKGNKKNFPGVVCQYCVRDLFILWQL